MRRSLSEDMLIFIALLFHHFPRQTYGKFISRRINDCTPLTYTFSVVGSSNASALQVNMHCAAPHVAFVVTGASFADANGVYEEYGCSSTAGVKKYEHVMSNGTTFSIVREEADEKEGRRTFVWNLKRSTKVLYRNSGDGGASAATYPPATGWKATKQSKSAQGAGVPTLKVHRFPRKAAQVVRYPASGEVEVATDGTSTTTATTATSSGRTQKFLSADGRLLDSSDPEAPADVAVAEQLLHPAVGRALGEELNAAYRGAQPYDAITIDGLLDPSMLRHALDFTSVPLKEWVGPEEGAPCCKGKYRLDFDHWNSSEYARALVLLATRPRFISFLEGLTGIDGLVSMRIQDRRLVSFGSSLIGVTSGGFLTVHNDFNHHAGLYRRLNALLYLNEDWVDAWQGHLELWSGDMTRCVQRIPPLFNRMAIFTVTDDAFHGHPEPLLSPPDTVRYALQLVYYTSEPGPAQSDRPGPKKRYNGTHSAVFQPTCSVLPGVRAFCKTATRPGNYTDPVACQCNHR